MSLSWIFSRRTFLVDSSPTLWQMKFFFEQIGNVFWVQKWHILREQKVQKWNMLRGEKGPKNESLVNLLICFCQKWCMGSFCLRNRDFGTKTNSWEFREVWLTDWGSIHLYKIYHKRLFVICSQEHDMRSKTEIGLSNRKVEKQVFLWFAFCQWNFQIR